MATVLLIGTLDTKGPETAYLRDHVRQLGCNTLVLDSGILGEAIGIEADFTRAQVAVAAGTTLDALRNAGTRGKAVEGMLKGVRKLTLELLAAGKIHGAVAVGGAEGSVLAAAAMKELPIGFPKLIVSPIASGQRKFGPFVGTRDVMVMHSIVDILGLNPISRTVFESAAAAIAGMAKEYARKNIDPDFKFTAMPQDMVLNGDNTITILSEEMKDFITARGYIAVNDLTDTCSELRGYVISKVQYANQHTMLLRHSMLLYERRIGYNDDITSIDNNLGSSYTYCDAPSGRYIIFNDMDENFDKKEADTRRAALKQTSEGSAVCCKLEEGKVEKFYLYGEPKKRKTTYINLEASSYDNNSHTLAALVYNADDARLENINVAWITFE